MQYLGQQAAVWQGCGVKEGAQQLLCIGKNIAPFTRDRIWENTI